MDHDGYWRHEAKKNLEFHGVRVMTAKWPRESLVKIRRYRSMFIVWLGLAVRRSEPLLKYKSICKTL